MRTLLVAVCITLVFAATAAAAGTATSPAKAQNLASPVAARAGGQATLTVTIVGAGTGWVTSDPAGISCGTICSAQFAVGTTVKLIGLAAVGSVEAGFSGVSCKPFGSKNLPPPYPPWCTFTLSDATSARVTFDVAPARALLRA